MLHCTARHLASVPRPSPLCVIECVFKIREFQMFPSPTQLTCTRIGEGLGPRLLGTYIKHYIKHDEYMYTYTYAVRSIRLLDLFAGLWKRKQLTLRSQVWRRGQEKMVAHHRGWSQRVQ